MTRRRANPGARQPWDRRRHALLASVLCLCAAVPVPAVAAERWAELGAELEAIAADAKLPGFGLVLLDARAPVLIRSSWDAKAPFRWGSITKTLTALAALKLVEEETLDLDAEVQAFVARGTYHNPWAAHAPLRLRHLLELTAGVSDLSAEEWSDNTPLPLSVALARRERTLLWPPGLQHSYSNYPPGLTAAVIEAASGERFERYLRAAVLLPLGMKQAAVDPVAGLSPGFAADGTTPLPYWHMTFKAFGALNASLPELARLLSMLLNQGRLEGRRLFAERSIAAMFAPGTTPAAARGLQTGYGAGMYSWIGNGHQFWGHGGDADGYRSRYGLLPQAGRGYLLAINADRPDALRRLRRHVEGALTRDLAEAPKPPPAKVDLSPYPGTYYPSAVRFAVAAWQHGEARQARVDRDGDSLILLRGQRRTRLVPVAPDLFRREADPVSTVAFVTDGDGALYLHGELGNYVRTDRCPGFLPHCHR